MASAQSRGVPVITARQLLTWTDGRNASSFGGLSWSGSTLSFHLKELMHAGLVTQEREGRNLIYRPSIQQMNDLLAYLTAHCCQGAACDVASTPGCTTC